MGNTASNVKSHLKNIVSVTGIDADKLSSDWKANKGDNTKRLKTVNKRVLDPLNDTMDSAMDLIHGHTKDTRSIIARSRNSILQFPVYISQSVPTNPAHIIARLYDRVYASFVQATLAMYPVISEDEVNELKFLRRYHTNINEAVEAVLNAYDTPIDDLDAMIQESVFYQTELGPNCTLECAWVPKSDADIIYESRRSTDDPLAGFQYLKEAGDDRSYLEGANRAKNDDKKKEYQELHDTIQSQGEVRWSPISQKEAIDVARAYMDYPPDDVVEDDEAMLQFRRDIMVVQKYENNKTSLNEMEKDRYEKLKDDHKIDDLKKFQVRAGRIYEKIESSKKVLRQGDRTMDAPVMLKDADLKRINGMVPWTIQATFRVRGGPSGTSPYDVKFIIGVKSTLHMISPKDLSSELKDLVMGNVKSLQKVRYKSGEITFMDYFLNLKGLKSDAAKRIQHNKRWINTLKKLADTTSGSEGFKSGKHPDNIPNATLVVTHQDVIKMANDTGIDLSSVSNAKRLAKSLFLISIAILDPTAGTMRVLFPDRDVDWDVQSIASIDAELARTDNSKIMSELNRLINKN